MLSGHIAAPAGLVPSNSPWWPVMYCPLPLSLALWIWSSLDYSTWAGCLELCDLQDIRCAHKQVGLPCCSAIMDGGSPEL